MKIKFKPDTARLWSAGVTPTLIDAMGADKTVSFIYDNKIRVVEGHAIGTSNKDGSLLFRGVQVGGEASAPLPAWRLFTIKKMFSVSFDDGIKSQAPREGFTSGDKLMREVIVELDLT